jgi:hypothetical protein
MVLWYQRPGEHPCSRTWLSGVLTRRGHGELVLEATGSIPHQSIHGFRPTASAVALSIEQWNSLAQP